MDVTIVDLRRRMGDIQAAVSRRERVLVRSHGRPWAVVTAWDEGIPCGKRACDFPAAGMWEGREDMENPTDWVRARRSRRHF